MGLPAKSRKGKKAWRKNLDDTEIVEVLQTETHQQRRGPAVETLKDDELFFVDKAEPEPVATILARKKAARQPRLTRAQLILQAPQSIKPVLVHKAPVKKDKLPRQLQQQVQKQTGKAGALAPVSSQQQAVAPKAPESDVELDLWNADPISEALSDGENLAAVIATREVKALKPVGPTSRAGRSKSKPLAAPRVKAVEVDLPGCSYNPDHEAHQDALAVLVANENKKLLKKEIARKAPPLNIDIDLEELQQQGDELARLQTDADMDENELQLEGDEGQGTAGGEDEDAVAKAKAKAEQKKKTKKDRNREARAAAEARALEEKKEIKRRRRELEALPVIASQVEEEEEEKALKRARRQVVEEEKALIQPPKLSKHRFEDLSVQVLTSDQVGQGLRRMKPFSMLAMERFKSMQKRGLVEVRKPRGTAATKKVIVYEKGARTEKAVEGQKDLEKLKKANQKMRKELRNNA